MFKIDGNYVEIRWFSVLRSLLACSVLEPWQVLVLMRGEGEDLDALIILNLPM